jgi:hypothetical protein
VGRNWDYYGLFRKEEILLVSVLSLLRARAFVVKVGSRPI